MCAVASPRGVGLKMKGLATPEQFTKGERYETAIWPACVIERFGPTGLPVAVLEPPHCPVPTRKLVGEALPISQKAIVMEDKGEVSLTVSEVTPALPFWR